MFDHSDKVIFEKITQYAVLKNKKILEIGCGYGRISTFIASEACSLIAIDPDQNAIENARKVISAVDFRVGTGENLAFSDNSFDLIIFTLSLHHQNSQKALKEAARTLKQGGKILVIEPTIEGEVEQVFAFLHNENRKKQEAQKSIANSNLSIIDSEVFKAKWEFSNKNDLINSVFQYYNKPYQQDIAEQIINFLGKKIELKPIILQDTMIIQSLILVN